MELQMTQTQRQRKQKRLSLQMERTQKPYVESEEQISQSDISSVFANAVKLYQRKNQNSFRCGNHDHLVKDCLKDLSKTTQKASLNMKEGMMKKGSWSPQKPEVTQLASLDKVARA